ncbi:MAG: hypothetical protein OEY91_15535, partial [Nitrospirota bacterium]|nr:hypothetical protein [Nitrospirota bacterium]
MAWAQDQPNVVLMLMDNLGWGEVGTYGGGILRGAETPRIDTLAATFAKTWQRPPTPEELAGLVRDRVREEVYYREAMAMGLDK